MRFGSKNIRNDDVGLSCFPKRHDLVVLFELFSVPSSLSVTLYHDGGCKHRGMNAQRLLVLQSGQGYVTSPTQACRYSAGHNVLRNISCCLNQWLVSNSCCEKRYCLRLFPVDRALINKLWPHKSQHRYYTLLGVGVMLPYLAHLHLRSTVASFVLKHLILHPLRLS